MNDLTRIVPTTGVTPAAPAAASAPGTNTFQALLDRLQRFAADQPKPEAVASPDELRAAMQAADASFTTAMDLRRQLEDAFRRHQP